MIRGMARSAARSVLIPTLYSSASSKTSWQILLSVLTGFLLSDAYHLVVVGLELREPLGPQGDELGEPIEDGFHIPNRQHIAEGERVAVHRRLRVGQLAQGRDRGLQFVVKPIVGAVVQGIMRLLGAEVVFQADLVRVDFAPLSLWLRRGCARLSANPFNAISINLRW